MTPSVRLGGAGGPAACPLVVLEIPTKSVHYQARCIVGVGARALHRRLREPPNRLRLPEDSREDAPEGARRPRARPTACLMCSVGCMMSNTYMPGLIHRKFVRPASISDKHDCCRTQNAPGAAAVFGILAAAPAHTCIIRTVRRARIINNSWWRLGSLALRESWR